MNETPQTDGAFDVPWPTSNHRLAQPDPSMLNGSAAAAAPPLGHRIEAAGDIGDAGDAGNTKNDANVANDADAANAADAADAADAAGGADADQALDATAADMRDIRDAWVEGVRGTVRSNPLACLAGAIAAGIVIARITR